MSLSGKTVLMVMLFVVSAFMFVGKLLTPIQIVIEEEEPIVVGQILSYTLVDIVMISVSVIVLGDKQFLPLVF